MDLVSFRETAERYSVTLSRRLRRSEELDGTDRRRARDGHLAHRCWQRGVRRHQRVLTFARVDGRTLRAAGRGRAPAARALSLFGLWRVQYLDKRIPYGKVAYLGKPESAHYIEIAGKIPVPVADCTAKDNVVAIVLLDDEGFDWFRDVNSTLNLIRRTNVPVVVANPDIAYPMRGNDIAIAVGSLGGLLSDITEKTFVRFGKPDSMMFAYALTRAQQIPNVTKRDVLFVGDTLRTDIIGANTYGFDATLVLSGNTLPRSKPTS